MSELKKRNFDYQEVSLVKSKFKTRLISCFEGESEGWFLLTNLKEEEFKTLQRSYSKRFNIEKMFQDFKSQGFDIEKSKIQKYSHFKRLLFATVIAKTLMLFVGDWVSDNADEIIKKYLLHIKLISAFSRLLYEPVLSFGKSP